MFKLVELCNYGRRKEKDIAESIKQVNSDKNRMRENILQRVRIIFIQTTHRQNLIIFGRYLRQTRT